MAAIMTEKWPLLVLAPSLARDSRPCGGRRGRRGQHAGKAARPAGRYGQEARGQGGQAGEEGEAGRRGGVQDPGRRRQALHSLALYNQLAVPPAGTLCVCLSMSAPGSSRKVPL